MKTYPENKTNHTPRMEIGLPTENKPKTIETVKGSYIQ